MKLISFDIETWGLKREYLLQPWRVKTKEAGILCAHFFDGKEFLENPKDEKALYCGWNLMFDTAWFLAQGKEQWLNYKYLDGRLLLKRMYQDLPTYGLKATLERFKDDINFKAYGTEYVSGYQTDIEFKAGVVDEVYTLEELDLMNEYCKRDCIYTRALIDYLMSGADKETISQAIRESTVSVLFADAWQRGIPLDRNEAILQEKEILDSFASTDEVLKEYGLTQEILRSPKQFREFLQSEWNIKLTKLTPKGEYSVDASVLKELTYKETDKSIKNLLQLIVDRKEYQTEYDKFILPALECLKESEVIHSEPFLNSTKTGRMTYSKGQTFSVKKQLKNGNVRETKVEITTGLPLHQMKRGDIRKMVVAPKGYKLVEMDFSAQEMRLIADIANETTMVKLFNAGDDLHAYTASKIYGYSFEEFQALKGTDDYKKMRHLGKLTNLGLQYRASAKRLHQEWHDKYGLKDKTIQDAEKARNTYLSLYNGIPRYWETSINFARNNGYVENKAGRRHYLDKWSGDEAWKSESIAVNFPIQSTGAEQTVLALLSLRRFIVKENVKLAWALHDGMYFFVPDCMMTNDIVAEMISIVDNIDYKKAWGWDNKVMYPVEAKIGNNWAELESFC